MQMMMCRLALVALVAAVTTSCTGREQPRAAILIVVDALRADHLGVYGYARPTSPNLDAWAREGRQFDRAYSTSTWTLPSFASLHTGQFPSRHRAGIAGFDGPDPIAANRLGTDVPTLAEAFAERRLITGAVVNNPLLEPSFGLQRGFQTYDYPQDSVRAVRGADQMVDRALTLIDQWRNQSFFLLIHFIDPHLDYDAPPPFRGRFSSAFDSQLKLPIRDLNLLRHHLGAFTDQDREFITAAYDEEVAFVDAQLGRLRSALATRGMLDRSLIVVTADHGEELFEHGGFEHGHAMWEEVVRVPLIIWGPGVIAGREASPVSLADIAPTMLEWADVPRRPHLDGLSLWPNLTTAATIPPRTLLAQGRIYGPPESMLLRWPLKVVVDAQLRPQRASDLDLDPTEQQNILDDRSEVVAQLVAELQTRLAAVRPDQQRQVPAGID